MIAIWVRSTVDWSDEQVFLAQAPADLPPKVELWNETFTIPFHLFRLRVRQIAEGNLARVEGAVCAAWEEIPGGALVLPVDDDDWFAPDVAVELGRLLDPAFAGYYWTASWVEVPTRLGHNVYLWRRRLLPWTPPKWQCSTNNYALLKGDGTEPFLANHVQASGWFGAHPQKVLKVDRPLSLTNRTLASRTTLRAPRPSLSRRELLGKYRRYRTLYDRPPRPELAWSRPYLEQMAELMRELELR